MVLVIRSLTNLSSVAVVLLVQVEQTQAARRADFGLAHLLQLPAVDRLPLLTQPARVSLKPPRLVAVQAVASALETSPSTAAAAVESR